MTQRTNHLPYLTLFLLLPFAAVNALLYSPSLPNIATFFNLHESTAKRTVTWFLLGYTFGQLIYGPLANRYGRKAALNLGVLIQILSSVLCIVSYYTGIFHLLILGRIFSAIGSGVGLNMTYTLIHETYDSFKARKTLSYLALSFAITPSLAITFGALLNTLFGWVSCFYASTIYGLILLMLIQSLPETMDNFNTSPIRIRKLLIAYGTQLKDVRFVSASLLLGLCTSFVYTFAAFAPLIAINNHELSSTQYGLLNLIPSLGFIIGAFTGPGVVEKHTTNASLILGFFFVFLGSLSMFVAAIGNLPGWITLFLPTILIYTGVCYISANAPVIALHNSKDKAHASAMMNFINLGTATVVLFTSGLAPSSALTLPIIFLVLTGLILPLYKMLK